MADCPRFMPGAIEDKAKLIRQQQSWMIAAVFSGLGTGFILFWVTLAITKAGVLDAIISLIVWPISRERLGSNFATKATIVFFVATIIGTLVGLSTTIGTGLPLSGP